MKALEVTKVIGSMSRWALAAVAVLAAVASAQPIDALRPQAGDGAIRVEAREQKRATTQGLPRHERLHASRAHAVRLPAPSAEKAAQVGRGAPGTPLKIGIARDVPDLNTEVATASALEWERLAGGALVADIAITSTGAAAVRAAIRIEALPDSAVLRFNGPGDDTLFDMTGRAVNEAIARNVAADGDNDDARTLWSPVIEGDTVVAEIELPAGADPLDVRIAMPRLSHLVTSAGSAFNTPTAIGGSASCEVDAMCKTGWSSQMNAVAEMIFSDGTGTYLCTGTLLADTDTASSLPYFLSARHCISSQTIASTLTTYWFYRSSACNTGTPGTYKQLTGGATLLYASSNTDTSFMRLANTPPQGTFFAGWYVGSTKSAGTALTTLHQPKGDLLKLSGGTLDGYLTCTPPTNGSFSCSNASASGSTFYDVSWVSGITEPGSSGSGLFLSDGSLIGQLYGGSSACTGGGSDAYGRLDVAYNAALKTWLAPTPAPTLVTLAVSTSGTGSGVVSSSPSGISCGATCSASFPSGTSVTLSATPAGNSTFAGWGGACSGTGGCVVALNAAATVSATFNAPTTADVSLSQSANMVTTTVGRDVVFTLTAGNSGPLAASAVTVTDTLPAGSAFVWASPGCSAAAATVTCNVGAVSVGGSATVRVVVRPTSAVTLTNTATAASVEPDPLSSNNGAIGVVTVSPAPAASARQRYRLYSPVTQEHLYTTDLNEYDTLGAYVGTWVQEGPVGKVLDNPGSFGGVAAVPYYRLYDTSRRWHHWTTDANEYYTLVTYPNWNGEGVDGYILPAAATGATQLFRLLYPDGRGLHHWTIDANEYATLIGTYGWIGEGGSGFVIQ